MSSYRIVHTFIKLLMIMRRWGRISDDSVMLLKNYWIVVGAYMSPREMSLAVNLYPWSQRESFHGVLTYKASGKEGPLYQTSDVRSEWKGRKETVEKVQLFFYFYCYSCYYLLCVGVGSRGGRVFLWLKVRADTFLPRASALSSATLFNFCLGYDLSIEKNLIIEIICQALRIITNIWQCNPRLSKEGKEKAFHENKIIIILFRRCKNIDGYLYYLSYNLELYLRLKGLILYFLNVY